MIKVIKENPVPKETVVCHNCGSELEYGNADLFEDYNPSPHNIGVSGEFHIICPVCGCETPASWVYGRRNNYERNKIQR